MPLALSLLEAGHDVWTPSRVLRRYMPAKTPSGKRAIETSNPILPTFVFIRAADTTLGREIQLRGLAVLAGLRASPHPAFSIFLHGGRAPLIGDREVAGLREEEAREAALIQAMRDAENHAEAERIRRAAIKSASARRRAEAALAREQRNARRSERSTIPIGADVEIAGVAAFIGVTGVMEGVDGHYAHVRFGTCSWKIEGWQVMPAPAALRSTAA